MNESKITVTKATRLGVLVLALLLALAALQAFSAKPAEAGACLESWCTNLSSGGGPIYFDCPTGLTKSPTALNWTGTDANDVKCGSDYADYMNGAGGSDTLYGLLGNPNTLIGGTGNDLLYGGNDYIAGADQIIPGDGQDKVYAQKGNDTVIVSADGQPDELDGGYGTDTLKITSCHLDSVDVVRDFEYTSRPAC